MEKKILLVITAYNTAKFVRAAIQSVKNQHYKNVEIVVVDDASTDNTSEEVKKENVTLYTLPKNIGCFPALNYALERHTDYDYFYYLSSDDVTYRSHLTELVNALEKNNALMAWCNYRRVDYATGIHSDEIRGYKASTVLWKKEAIDKIGHYDNTRFGGDTELWERFLLYYPENKIVHVNKVLANCTLHGKNLTILIKRDKRNVYVKEFRARHEKIKSEIENQKSKT